MASIDNLTFGIEIEVVAAWPRQDDPDETSYDPVMPKPTPAQAIFYAMLGSVKEGMVEFFAAEKTALPDDYDAESVELASRRFDFFCDDWRQDIQRVLDMLRNMENLGCRLFTNKSTGCHVHVGNGDRVVHLRAAKNLMQLATTSERLFDELHAANRIVYPQNFYPTGQSVGDFWHTPMTWFHQNNEEASFAGLNSICSMREEAAQANGICTKPSFGHNSSYNFDNLYPARPGYPCTGTIEFRQHASMTDILEIVHWVLLTTSMVRYCSEAPAVDFLALRAHGIDQDFEVRDVLSAIGCPAETIGYFVQDEGDATIGFLGASGTAPAAAATMDLDELVARNDVEQSDRLSEKTRDAIIAGKDYGFKGEVNVVHITVEAIERYYLVAAAEIYNTMPANWSSEYSDSQAKYLVWQLWPRITKTVEMEVEAFAQKLGVAARVVDPRFVTTYVKESAVYTKTFRRTQVFVPESWADWESVCAVA